MTKNDNPRLFYGYVVVIASFFIVLVMHGTGSSFGVFFNPLQAEFGWTRATIAGARSISTLLMGIFAMVSGRLTDRFGPRITVTVCGLVLGLGYYLTSQVNTVWQLFLFYGVLTGIGHSSGDVALLSTTARWFVRRRGMMSAVVKVGTGTGMLIMPLVVSRLISNYGWRDSYVILGIISVVCIVSIAQLLRRDPSQKGLKPYSAREGSDSGSNLTGGGYTLREATHTRQFWMVCAVYFLIWGSTSSIFVHIVPHTIDLGVPAARAATVMSTIGGVSIAGRMVMGSAGDRIGNRRTLLICFIILITALSWLQLARQLWALYLFATVYGFAHGAFFTVGSLLVAELFGTKAHGAIFGTTLFVGQIGGAIGPVVTGRAFDVTNSYQTAFLVLIAVSVAGFILTTRLKPIKVSQEN